jgi:hypothetical protein
MRILSTYMFANGEFSGHLDLMFPPQHATAHATLSSMRVSWACDGWIAAAAFFTRTAAGKDKRHDLSPTQRTISPDAVVSGVRFGIGATSDIDVTGTALVFLT